MMSVGQRQFVKLSLSFILGLLLVSSWGLLASQWPIAAQSPLPRSASTVRVEDAAKKVYEKLPSLPLENQYVRKETGQVDPNYTLINRFIRYHQDVKKRPVRYRFDWLITFADYLGVNEEIVATAYPGATTLQSNPMASDIKQIQALNRSQRQALVDVLAQIYKPQVEASSSPSKPGETPKPTPSPAVVEPTKPGLSSPGDAQWLKF